MTGYLEENVRRGVIAGRAVVAALRAERANGLNFRLTHYRPMAID